jgi:PAS domain S-box-containing protein
MSARRISVVNDDRAQLRMISGLIERLGYDVTAYDDPGACLDDLQRGVGTDLFVLDMHMPGIDGWKLCRLLRSAEFQPFNAIPILIVSASLTEVDPDALTAELGANAFLPLPFNREDLLEHVVDLLNGKVPRRRSKVLVVEDDPGVRRAVRTAFENEGFTVATAPTAGEGMELWRDEPADIVLLDYHLPDDTCDGLISRLRGSSTQAVLLVMTGDMDLTLPVSLMRMGADGYVRKPFDPALVVELARRAQRERALLRVETMLEERTRELNASERRFRSLFDAIPDLVVVLDENGTITRASEAAGQALRADIHLTSTDRAAAGWAFLDLVPEADMDHVRASLDGIRHQGMGVFETRMLAPTGELWVEVTGTTIEDEDRPALLLVARDQTWRRDAERERKKLEDQFSHAQRLDSLGMLAGGVAHDFNNLLTGILGNAQLAKLELSEDDAVSDHVAQIETAALRAAELTKQILTFAGRADTVKRPIDLPALVEEMGKLLERAVAPRARIELGSPEALRAIHGDPSQIRQVVMNLIMNASDALGHAYGTISVTVREERLDKCDLLTLHLGASATPGRYACLEVVDDGCGMARDTLQRIFDPFYTTKEDGHGLGLATTIGIVRAHGGLIGVASSPGEGTRFRVYLPYVGTPHVDPASEPSTRPGTTSLGGSWMTECSTRDSYGSRRRNCPLP